MNISGNTILITGGTSGIGLAFAEQFYQAKSQVIICGRRQQRLDQLRQTYPGLITITCDVSDQGQRRSLHNRILNEFPQTNILINNAGVQLVADLTREVTLERVREEVEINLIAPIHLASLFASHLAEKPQAALINVTSGLAFVPISFMPVYCATKAAMHSMTLSLRHQLRGTRVQVFEIIPPSVDTELGHERRSDKTQTHGGMPVSEFIKEAMEALRNDVLEAPIGQAKGIKAKGEELFARMNPA
jgi:uncharacterized oxidoreductase